MTSLYIIIIILVLFVLAVALLFFREQKEDRERRTDTLYYEALNLLLLGDTDGAYAKLTAVVKKHSDHVAAYIHIGNILREKDQYQKALKVHQNLLRRPQLAPDLKNQVLKGIARDYIGLEDLQNAIATLEDLTSFWKKDPQLNRELLRLYEKDRQWDKALAVKRQLLKSEEKKDDSLVALYLVQAGIVLMEKKEWKKARSRFQEALSTDPECAAAYLYLGHAFHREGKSGDALKQWKKMAEKLPDSVFLVYPTLETILKETGQEAELENIYRIVLKNQPREVHSLLALAELLNEKGDTSDAVQLCHQALVAKPRQLAAYCQLLTYQQDDAQAIKETLEKMKPLCAPQTTFICRTCHHRASEPLWRCPQCDGWQTFGI